LPPVPPLHVIAGHILAFAETTRADKEALERVWNGYRGTEAFGQGADTEEGEDELNGGMANGEAGKQDERSRRHDEYRGGEKERIRQIHRDQLVDEDQFEDRAMDAHASDDDDDGDLPGRESDPSSREAAVLIVERMIAEPGSRWMVTKDGMIVREKPSTDARTSLAKTSGRSKKTREEAQDTAPSSRVIRIQEAFVKEESVEPRSRVISDPMQPGVRRKPRQSLIPQPVTATPPPKHKPRRHTEGPSASAVVDVARRKRMAEMESLRGRAGDPIARSLEEDERSGGESMSEVHQALE
jgi:hypothetical protein